MLNSTYSKKLFHNIKYCMIISMYQQHMFKDTRTTSINCVFMSIDVVLMSFLLILDIFQHHFLEFYIVNMEQVNTDWECEFHYKLALNFSYHSHTQQSIVNLLELKWALNECC